MREPLRVLYITLQLRVSLSEVVPLRKPRTFIWRSLFPITNFLQLSFQIFYSHFSQQRQKSNQNMKEPSLFFTGTCVYWHAPAVLLTPSWTRKKLDSSLYRTVTGCHTVIYCNIVNKTVSHKIGYHSENDEFWCQMNLPDEQKAFNWFSFVFFKQESWNTSHK